MIPPYASEEEQGQDGRVGKPTGLSQVEPQEGLAPSGFDPSRKPFAPYPNSQTRATFEQLIEWASAVVEGQWTWVRNGRCKYVTLRIDTRAGAHTILDRDGNEISLAELCWQYRRDSAAPSGDRP